MGDLIGAHPAKLGHTHGKPITSKTSQSSSTASEEERSRSSSSNLPPTEAVFGGRGSISPTVVGGRGGQGSHGFDNPLLAHSSAGAAKVQDSAEVEFASSRSKYGSHQDSVNTISGSGGSKWGSTTPGHAASSRMPWSHPEPLPTPPSSETPVSSNRNVPANRPSGSITDSSGLLSGPFGSTSGPSSTGSSGLSSIVTGSARLSNAITSSSKDGVPPSQDDRTLVFEDLEDFDLNIDLPTVPRRDMGLGVRRELPRGKPISADLAKVTNYLDGGEPQGIAPFFWEFPSFGSSRNEG